MSTSYIESTVLQRATVPLDTLFRLQGSVVFSSCGSLSPLWSTTIPAAAFLNSSYTNHQDPNVRHTKSLTQLLLLDAVEHSAAKDTQELVETNGHGTKQTDCNASVRLTRSRQGNRLTSLKEYFIVRVLQHTDEELLFYSTNRRNNTVLV